MNTEQAAQRLKFHTLPESGAFLEMLRPFRGVRREVLDDVWEALEAAAPLLSAGNVTRDLASALWAISYLGRSWALDPDGMLQRNHLIDDSDLKQLTLFLARFDYAVMVMLDGGTAKEAYGSRGW